MDLQLQLHTNLFYAVPINAGFTIILQVKHTRKLN